MSTGRKLALGAGVVAGIASCCGLGSLGLNKLAAPSAESAEPVPDALSDELTKSKDLVNGCTNERQSKDLLRAQALTQEILKIPGVDLPGETSNANVTCSTRINHGGSDVFGFVTAADPAAGNTLAVSPAFFLERNAGCDRAGALYGLDLCASRGDCSSYDGPNTPYLPFPVRDATREFLADCKAKEAGILTSGGARFEGEESEGTYTGTVSYPSGAVAEGTFFKYGDVPEFSPFGPLNLTLANGDRLETSVDWDNTTEEPAKLTSQSGPALHLRPDTEKPDFNWTVDGDTTDLTKTNYELDWATMELKTEELAEDPSGTERHKLTDEEFNSGNYSAYGIYKYPKDHVYKAYEGNWTNSEFDGDGTLLTNYGETLQTTFRDGKVKYTSDAKFKATPSSRFVTLTVLPESNGWMLWTNQKAGKWDKYTWDDIYGRMEIAHMVPGSNN